MLRLGIILKITASMMILSSCQKSGNYIVRGYLYEDCNLTPVPNQYLELVQGVTGGLGPTSGGFLVSGYTDSTGYFELAYEAENTLPIELREESAELMVNIPSWEDLNDLRVFRQPTTNVQVSLNVINAYGVGDTLCISNVDPTATEMIKVACPLTSGVLYTATDIPVFNYDYNGEYTDVIWWINDYKVDYQQKNFYIDAYCTDTVFVTLDIY